MQFPDHAGTRRQAAGALAHPTNLSGEWTDIPLSPSSSFQRPPAAGALPAIPVGTAPPDLALLPRPGSATSSGSERGQAGQFSAGAAGAAVAATPMVDAVTTRARVLLDANRGQQLDPGSPLALEVAMARSLGLSQEDRCYVLEAVARQVPRLASDPLDALRIMTGLRQFTDTITSPVRRLHILSTAIEQMNHPGIDSVLAAPSAEELLHALHGDLKRIEQVFPAVGPDAADRANLARYQEIVEQFAVRSILFSENAFLCPAERTPLLIRFSQRLTQLPPSPGTAAAFTEVAARTVRLSDDARAAIGENLAQVLHHLPTERNRAMGFDALMLLVRGLPGTHRLQPLLHLARQFDLLPLPAREQSFGKMLSAAAGMGFKDVTRLFDTLIELLPLLPASARREAAWNVLAGDIRALPCTDQAGLVVKLIDYLPSLPSGSAIFKGYMLMVPCIIGLDPGHRSTALGHLIASLPHVPLGQSRFSATHQALLLIRQEAESDAILHLRTLTGLCNTLSDPASRLETLRAITETARPFSTGGRCGVLLSVASALPVLMHEQTLKAGVLLLTRETDAANGPVRTIVLDAVRSNLLSIVSRIRHSIETDGMTPLVTDYAQVVRTIAITPEPARGPLLEAIGEILIMARKKNRPCQDELVDQYNMAFQCDIREVLRDGVLRIQP